MKVIQIIIAIGNKFSPIKKIINYYLLIKNAKKRSILVYTMAKVGSRTITENLIRDLENYSIYQIHWIEINNIMNDLKFKIKIYVKNRIKGIKHRIVPQYLLRGFYINKRIEKIKNENELKIITLTRDPVARNISAFFENLKVTFGYDLTKREREFEEKFILKELENLFLEDFTQNNGVHFIDCNPLTWFDVEIKQVFNFDVFEKEFPKEKGYQIYNCEDFSILIMRLEDLDRSFTEASIDLFDKKLHIRKSKNTASRKEYSSMYKKFKSKIILPDWYLDTMYNSKYARHFYTLKEIREFRTKWASELPI